MKALESIGASLQAPEVETVASDVLNPHASPQNKMEGVCTFIGLESSEPAGQLVAHDSTTRISRLLTSLEAFMPPLPHPITSTFDSINTISLNRSSGRSLRLISEGKLSCMASRLNVNASSSDTAAPLKAFMLLKCAAIVWEKWPMVKPSQNSTRNGEFDELSAQEL